MKDWLREFHIFRNVYSEFYCSAACQTKVYDGFYVFYVLHCKKSLYLKLHSISNCKSSHNDAPLHNKLCYMGGGGDLSFYGNK